MVVDFYICKRNFKISEAKIKEGIFVGPQIREHMKDNSFKQKLNDLENHTWRCFGNFTKNFR